MSENHRGRGGAGGGGGSNRGGGSHRGRWRGRGGNNHRGSKRGRSFPSDQIPQRTSEGPDAKVLAKKIKTDNSNDETKAPKPQANTPPEPPQEKKREQAHLSTVTFDSLQISEDSKRAIREELKFEFLTKVQEQTLSAAMEGTDVLAKAKTGSGKTIAFLLPCVERFKKTKHGQQKVSALILSPTRELATQIATEAKHLVKFHKIQVGCVIGGTNMNKDTKQLDNGLGLLVATPGRLIDHLQQNSCEIVRRLGEINTLVLDEADRLLDMGFRAELDKILSFLPKERQTLLFSATLPESLQEMKATALRADHKFVDCIGEENQTHVHVKQQVSVVSLDGQTDVLEQALVSHITASGSLGYKIIVFFPTARHAGFMAELFQDAGYKVLEMHSRKSQAFRTKVSDQFRKGDNLIMFSSDVSARGVDYPDVSLVVQVGLTSREHYIHRLGRTARAGRAGEGLLLLSEFEKRFLKSLNDIPLEEIVLSVDHSKLKCHKRIENLKKKAGLRDSAEKSYQAWLRFYNSNLKALGLDKVRLVELANEYSRTIGLSEPPMLEKKTVGKMHLQGVPGLRVQSGKHSR